MTGAKELMVTTDRDAKRRLSLAIAVVRALRVRQKGKEKKNESLLPNSRSKISLPLGEKHELIIYCYQNFQCMKGTTEILSDHLFSSNQPSYLFTRRQWDAARTNSKRTSMPRFQAPSPKRQKSRSANGLQMRLPRKR